MSKLLTSTHSWLRTRRGWMLALAAALLFGLPVFVFNGFGASDYLLEIEGIKGESSDAKHPGTIEIDSFSWGMSNVPSSAGGGGGAGKVSVHDISITKSVDKSSPKLMLTCCTGQHIPTAMLYYSKVLPLGQRVEYLKIKLSDILISGYNFAPGHGGGGLTPTDSISINFAKIEMTYIVHDANGVPGEVVTASCDIKNQIFQ